MKRLIGSMTFALIALVLFAPSAAAGREWCAKDPVVTLNGTAVQILVAVPAEYIAAVSGPIHVQIAVPSGVQTEVIYLDAGFNNHGESVRFRTTDAVVAADGSFDVRIRAHVPVNLLTLRHLGLPIGGIPLQVTVVTNGDLAWDNGLPSVLNGETTIVEGSSIATFANVTVRGSN